MQTMSDTNTNTKKKKKKKNMAREKSYNCGLNQQLIYLIY